MRLSCSSHNQTTSVELGRWHCDFLGPLGHPLSSVGVLARGPLHYLGASDVINEADQPTPLSVTVPSGTGSLSATPLIASVGCCWRFTSIVRDSSAAAIFPSFSATCPGFPTSEDNMDGVTLALDRPTSSSGIDSPLLSSDILKPRTFWIGLPVY